MLKEMKSFFTGVAVTLVFTLMIGVVYASVEERTISVLFDNIKILINGAEMASTDIEPFIYNSTTYVPIRAVSEALGKQVDWDSENKTVLINDLMNEPVSNPMSDLGFDTHYSPLPDINSDKIIERKQRVNQIENNGTIFEKTSGYEAVVNKDDFSVLLSDENGNYIAVGEIEQSGGYRDICINKYDTNGNKIKSQTYGGSDFEMLQGAKYNPKMGIVITGISQSKDGDFANDRNTPFVACIDAQTLKVKWVSNVQIADFVYCVTDEAVFVVRNEGNPENTDLTKAIIIPDKLSIVKLDHDGKKVWQTEPLEQWIDSIAELNDGRIVIVQKYAGDNGISGSIYCYSKDGEKLSKIEADCYGDVTPTDDSGFITVSIRNIKTVPQPVYISAIWFDTETVVTKYDKDNKVEWRKTYDNAKDSTGFDKVIPQSDGSVIVDVK